MIQQTADIQTVSRLEFVKVAFGHLPRMIPGVIGSYSVRFLMALIQWYYGASCCSSELVIPSTGGVKDIGLTHDCWHLVMDGIDSRLCDWYHGRGTGPKLLSAQRPIDLICANN